MEEQLDWPDRDSAFTRRPGSGRALPLADKMLVGICWLMLGTASFLISLVPSSRVLRGLGSSIGAVAYEPMLTSHQRGRAQRIGRAIAIATRHAPFRADCYPQALVAAQLCRWFAIPYALHLGARFAASSGDRPGRLEGHAWVAAAGMTICGGAASIRQFGTVACFVHFPRSTAGDDRD